MITSLLHIGITFTETLLWVKPPVAFAADVSSTVNAVGGFLPSSFATSIGCSSGDACGFVNIVSAVVTNLRPLIGIVAVFLITLSGFRMIITEEEESFTKSKRIISASITGIMLAYLVEPFVNAFYGGLAGGPGLGGVFGGIGIGSVPSGNVLSGATILHGEVIGILNWVMVFVAVLSILVMVISGIKAITQAGSEEGVTQLRRTVFSVLTGILLIVFRQALVNTFGLTALSMPGTPSVSPAAAAAVTVINFILGFMALIAVVMIVYAGFLMILNLGNEEQFNKAKSLIFRVGIGFIVIIFSWALVQFITTAMFATP